MTDAQPDSRGGLFIDSGDGRGPIHTDDLTDAEREAHGLVPGAPTTPSPAEATAPDSVTEDTTDGR